MEIEKQNKIVILTFIANYLPGYKAGGILRTMVNTVDFLNDEFDFFIVTQDRDLKDSTSYPNVSVNQWQQVGGAMVYYLSPNLCTLKNLAKLVAETPYDIIYLNSFFDPVFTIKLLFLRRIGFLPNKPLILAPRGELVEGPLRLKYSKKITYILLVKIIGLYKNIIWQASSEFEAQDFVRVMNINPDLIHVALDLPYKTNIQIDEIENLCPEPDSVELKMIFLSRITREKNLDYALRVLTKVTTRVVFDIYGPTEDALYWKECKDLFDQLPENVIVNYLGSIKPNQVLKVLSRYDLFFFPTTGENYGHVIAEALTVGTPVLISNETPWRNLQIEELGWDLCLAHQDSFVAVIEAQALMNAKDRLQLRAKIKIKISKRLLDPAVLEANRQLFRKQLLAF